MSTAVIAPLATPSDVRVGMHVLADLHDIEPAMLGDAQALERLLSDAARNVGATIVGSQFRHFGGEYGVTGVVLLAESHITIHTWPEYGFAAVDAFMCGRSRADQAVQHIADGLKAGRVVISVHMRGGAGGPA